MDEAHVVLVGDGLMMGVRVAGGGPSVVLLHGIPGSGATGRRRATR